MTYRRSRRVLQRTVGAEVLLTTVEDPSVHRLSGSAGAAWIILESPMTAEQLASDLASVYRVDVHAVSSDVRALVDNFVEQGWLVATPDDDE
jgi:Coenzyme PQQ synthesis protein D (PqqD)